MVQGWIADDPIDDNVICTAYARTHWVNPKTGKVLGAVCRQNGQHSDF
jgi:hypothetical protein